MGLLVQVRSAGNGKRVRGVLGGQLPRRYPLTVCGYKRPSSRRADAAPHIHIYRRRRGSIGMKQPV